MKTNKFVFAAVVLALAGAGLSASTFAQTPAPSPGGVKAAASAGPSEAEITAMSALAQPGENHKLLAGLAGSWDYQVKMWTNPSEAPGEWSGTAVRKPMMDGRYFVAETTGKMQMPGPDGKLQDMEFKGMSIEGYDNAKQKFVSTWTDNMGTGILMSEGTYDPATKTFTYFSEMEVLPGLKMKVRETIKVIDNNHHVFEWYENRGGKDVKTMEIAYTRKS